MALAGLLRPGDTGHYNSAWWALREKYQGVAPPVARSEADFDPGAKYHIPGNMPYMRYFLARVYQFQFYRAMCQASGYKGPLNRCSVYGSKEAGERLNAMLELGCSKPWPEALKAMTGTDKADASAIIGVLPAADGLAQRAEQGRKRRLDAAGGPDEIKLQELRRRRHRRRTGWGG